MTVFWILSSSLHLKYNSIKKNQSKTSTRAHCRHEINSSLRSKIGKKNRRRGSFSLRQELVLLNETVRLLIVTTSFVCVSFNYS